MTHAAKLIGFLVLLAVIFAGAHVAGAALGPVTTGRSPVTYDGGGSGGMGGMNMGGNPWPVPAPRPASRSRRNSSSPG